MKKTLSRILVVFIIATLFLPCAFNAYAGDNGTAATGESPYAEVKIYSEDSSHGKVIGGGTMVVDADAYILAVGNRLSIEGVNKYVYASPKDGYVFDGWENVPESKCVKEGTVILAKFSPVGINTTSNVSASVSNESKEMGTIVPASQIKVLTNSTIQEYGSTLLIAKDAFSAVPKKGYIFSHWEGVPEDGMICGDTILTAVFETPQNPVTVTVTKPATGGSFVSSTGSTEITLESGAEIKTEDQQIILAGKEYVEAIPYNDYEFAGWSGIPDNGIITSDISISAAFTPSVTDNKPATYSYSTATAESFRTDAKYGDMDDPVSDGLWVKDNDSSWTYQWQVPMANAWGCLDNPYANEGQPGHGWFFFDRTGQMQTGWRLIDDKWYYFEPVSNGCKGQLYANTTTPDGYKVDENGVRIEE